MDGPRFEHVRSLGQLIASLKSELLEVSRGKLHFHGQGLMWGGLWEYEDVEERAKAGKALREACAEEGVWPYFTPTGCVARPFAVESFNPPVIPP
jgi:hypothetical protein